jgi:hypothetical protein
MQVSLARKKAIESVAEEEFDLHHGRDMYGSAWVSATDAQRKAAIEITTETLERLEAAVGCRLGEALP